MNFASQTVRRAPSCPSCDFLAAGQQLNNGLQMLRYTSLTSHKVTAKMCRIRWRLRAEVPPQTPLGVLTMLAQTPSRLGKGIPPPHSPPLDGPRLTLPPLERLVTGLQSKGILQVPTTCICD